MSSTVNIKTDKLKYKKAEMVQIKVSNDSDKVVNFINGGFGLEISHQDTIVWSMVGPEVLTPLEPGQSKTFAWDQRNRDEEQVSAGIYNASVKYYVSQNNLLYSSEEFEIIDK